MTQDLIEGPQGRLFVDEDASGHRLPVLFVHSDGGDLGHWSDIRARLAGSHPTAAFDRRGHGLSEAPRDGAFEQEEMAADILAVADALGWPRFVLVGHSGGALNAYAFAALHPERIAGLCLVDPPGDPAALPPGMLEGLLKQLRGDDWRTVLEQYYRSISGPDSAVADLVLQTVRRTPRETILGTFKALSHFAPRAFAGRYRGPALSVIQSQYDVEGALHRIPPGFPRAVIDGAGHWLQLGAPDRFAATLEEFVEWTESHRNRDMRLGFVPSDAAPHHQT